MVQFNPRSKLDKIKASFLMIGNYSYITLYRESQKDLDIQSI